MLKQNRIYGLDLLRALAILSVVYGHGYLILKDYVKENLYQFISFDGVAIFFVLSGFLIGGILLKTLNQTQFSFKELVNFWIRRWFRTLPNYFLILILMIAVNFMNHPLDLPDNLLSYFTFTQNFIHPHPSFFPEVWSLAIEEWFYLLVPFIVFLLLRYSKFEKKQVLLFCSICIIVFSTSFRIYKAYYKGHVEMSIWDWDAHIRKEVLTHLDAIMFGFLGAYLNNYYPKIFNAHKNILFYIGLFLLAFDKVQDYSSFYNTCFQFTIISLGVLFLLPKLTTIKSTDGIICKSITFISLISYSLYLLHHSLIQHEILPILMFYLYNVFPFLQNQNFFIGTEYLMYWFISITLAYMLNRFYEIPMMNLRENIRVR